MGVHVEGEDTGVPSRANQAKPFSHARAIGARGGLTG